MQGEGARLPFVDEGRKRVIGNMAAILASLHMRTAAAHRSAPGGEHSMGRADYGEN